MSKVLIKFRSVIEVEKYCVVDNEHQKSDAEVIILDLVEDTRIYFTLWQMNAI